MGISNYHGYVKVGDMEKMISILSSAEVKTPDHYDARGSGNAVVSFKVLSLL